MKFKLFFLLSLLITTIFSSLQLAAMFDEKKPPAEDSFHNKSSAVTKNTEQHRHQYEPPEIDDSDLSFQGSETQEEEGTDTDLILLSETILTQRLREAKKTTRFWKREADRLGGARFARGISSDSERASAIQCAHRAYDYWSEISLQYFDFLDEEKKDRIDKTIERMEQESQIIDLIEAADSAADQAQRAFDLLLGHHLASIKKADPKIQKIYLSQEKSPFAKSVITENEKLPKTDRTPSASQNRPATVMEKGYLFPSKGGGSFNNRWYTEHALERMAPPTPEILELLHARIIQRAEREGLNFE